MVEIKCWVVWFDSAPDDASRMTTWSSEKEANEVAQWCRNAGQAVTVRPATLTVPAPEERGCGTCEPEPHDCRTCWRYHDDGPCPLRCERAPDGEYPDWQAEKPRSGRKDGE